MKRSFAGLAGRSRSFAPVAVLVLLALVSCFPTFEDVPSLVSEPRILAVRTDPPEAEPMKTAALKALLASPDGTLPDTSVEWSLCLQARTLSERNGVAPDCLPVQSGAVLPLNGSTVELPLDSCARFGPNPPPAEPDQPALRPADPDPTGGYYLPVRARAPMEAIAGATEPLLAFGFERLRCSLAGAPREIFRDFQLSYTNNSNPTIEAIELVETDGSTRAADAANVAPSSQARLRIRWPGGAAEAYPYYDLVTVKLIEHVEAIGVSWFSSAGRFETDRSGRTEEEIGQGLAFVENTWTAPSTAGPVHFWIVIRDARGGVDWRELTIEAR